MHREVLEADVDLSLLPAALSLLPVALVRDEGLHGAQDERADASPALCPEVAFYLPPPSNPRGGVI